MRTRRLVGRQSLLIGLAFVLGAVPACADVEGYEPERQRMIRLIEAETRATEKVTGIDELDPEVLGAMARVPRHVFVPRVLVPYAYEPRPLPVAEDQNVAAPFLVALMTHLAEVKPGDRVFETGTGAGYHAAVLADMKAEVFSVEVIEPLARLAARRLGELGYHRVRIRPGDGYYGWVDEGPYDAIIVKEAVNHVPDPLLRQLKPGGRMVLPLGPPNGTQALTVVQKQDNGAILKRRILPVRFSPLQGGERL